MRTLGTVLAFSFNEPSKINKIYLNYFSNRNLPKDKMQRCLKTEVSSQNELLKPNNQYYCFFKE